MACIVTFSGVIVGRALSFSMSAFVLTALTTRRLFGFVINPRVWAGGYPAHGSAGCGRSYGGTAMKKHIRLNRGYEARRKIPSIVAVWIREVNASLAGMYLAARALDLLRASLRGPYAQLGAAPQARRGLVETDIT